MWVANAPDILFYPDADRDGRADGPPQQVLTGFGRDDTHELPNSLTWGPDGWLYGLNGVFNASHVRYGKDNAYLKPSEKEKHPGWKITCAMFRIHPRTREFQVFCEGTSNPWGIAFNDNGDAFVSACVIDHLWHLVETGYYHRQGGPYPPHTWKLESIVDYKHQMAAYCGITWFDSDAYPEEFRKKLYMGNIHGGCINVDGLERHGATYKGIKHDDFLTANDVWFMPVVQKVGPDGCLYILDWYDRYHCYQDANYDPPGVDRAKGRLYRVRYKETPRAPKFDLVAETDDQLIERLSSGNIFYREQAQRVLAERLGREDNSVTRQKLETIASDASSPQTPRFGALWTMVGSGRLNDEFYRDLLSNHVTFPPMMRAWGARAAGDFELKDAETIEEVRSLALSMNNEVRPMGVVAMRKLIDDDALPTLLSAASGPRDPRSPVVQAVVWQNIEPFLRRDGGKLPQIVRTSIETSADGAAKFRSGGVLEGLTALAPRLVEWYLAQDAAGAAPLAEIFAECVNLDEAQALKKGIHVEAAQGLRSVLIASLAAQAQSGSLNKLRDKLEPLFNILAERAAEYERRHLCRALPLEKPGRRGKDAALVA
ncbi:MAG: hypothetical protein QM775_07325 [Pirellulales bacterium]